uniref:Fatty acid hydroxylase domain-containing protein n=1 Tax=Paramoeba aestuarina TaxID=180227 RepID=A0A7S4PI00_9EUKA|mmetsp:Transcript_662/g.1123  ORF Transcript_662/g.1123 Transcript_662/m.1123 type:complete len:141 (+) Transcript_662:5-427(+)
MTFFLYWGHRVQHEVEFLWKNFHYFHHQLITPTPVGTVFIHPIDATLQGGIPILLAAISTQPHPLTFACFAFCRVAENVANHSGTKWSLMDLLFLKCLPFRAGVIHHDSHHKFSNYSRNAKNYGEAFWLWDYVFGTFRNV